MRNKHIPIILSMLAATTVATVVSAGDLNTPPRPPETTSSYMLEDIYDRLSTGAAGTQVTFTEPISGPMVGTGHTLDEIMAVAPQADDTNGATASQVVSGTTYWSLRNGAWGLQTGAMLDNGVVIITPTVTSQTITVGYHDGSGYVAGDADLVSGNILDGVVIFGVTGTASITAYPAPVPKTGQVTSYANGDDGDLEIGTAWPDPRYITSTAGVVLDTLTGLIWLQNANCIRTHYPGFDNDGTAGNGDVTWQHALDFVAGINGGTYSDCGASFTDWRLPNVKELLSVINYSHGGPDLRGVTGVERGGMSWYWSSTTFVNTSSAWNMWMGSGDAHVNDKTGTGYVWPVRGGQ